MSRTEEFAELRPVLFAIAHRILGSTEEAEDAVHQAWLRYEDAPAEPASRRRFLSAEVTRIAAGLLRPAPQQPSPQQPAADQPAEGAEPHATAAVDERGALERGEPLRQPHRRRGVRLGPLERAVFVLREVFGCGLAQIASALGCSQAVCRQLAASVTAGNGGSRAQAWPGRIVGAEHVARVLGAIGPALTRFDVTMEPRHVGSRPGVVFRDRNGHVLSTLVLDVVDGRIHKVRWVNDPGTPAADLPAAGSPAEQSPAAAP
ncbi:RNA polymerase subunit sigma-24 [Streptomyces sp. MBT97]|uniref:sigma factor-like helix-turn-helix DNA-binding protein n=1 Tax=Streptomyces sp. MBT97 TaxID=2800411 RepID=UPI00190DD871|nr:sigma factor-like helix-turn-helix DNA-binding protein [Streptomyces sp. MBT97]MBK3635569.1 RNA polymerase subunit sigma-24 [Streptomyces sp. MBT97]